MSKRTVDLFSGCGGMSLGFENAGFDVVAAFDNWDTAVNLYSLNFKHPILQRDLSKPFDKEGSGDKSAIDEIKGFSPEVIIGGPPCQDFSIAGKRENRGRANLTVRFAEMIAEVRPEWFVMENVYNIERMSILDVAIDKLKAAGYGLTRKVLNASLCGVPQARRRFFLIGHLGDEDGFLDGIIEGSLATEPLTVRKYLEQNGLWNGFNTQYYYMHPRSYNRRAVFSVDEPSATIRGINRPIPASYKRHHADKAGIEEGVRALTTKERSYIQSFPDSYKIEGAKTAVELAIGNAVPVNLARFVADCINAYEEASDGNE